MPKQKNKGKNKNRMSQAIAMARSRGRLVVPRPVFSLSACARKYLLACLDPWHPDAAGACLPISPARSSQKVTSFTRFPIAAISGSVAYVLLTPSLANNRAFAWVTTGTAAVTDANPVISATNTTTSPGWVPVNMVNLPYSRDDLMDTTYSEGNVQGRIISVGIRVWYAGTALNEGGIIQTYCDPVHNNMFGSTQASLGSKKYARYERFRANQKYGCSVYATNTDEWLYNASRGSVGGSGTGPTMLTLYPFSSSDYLSAATSAGPFENGAAPAIIAIAPPFGVSVAAQVEIIVHCEYVGTLTEGRCTASSSDNVGAEVVQNIMAKAEEAVAVTGVSLGQAARAVQQAASDVSGHVIRNVARGAIEGFMGPRQRARMGAPPFRGAIEA